jgi:hypothetical protein
MSEPQAAAYDPADVAPVRGPGSRFDLDRTPAGWTTPHPSENASAQWLRLADAAQREAEPRSEESRRVQLWRIGKERGRARYVLIRRGTVEAIPTLENRMPQRIRKVEGRGGAVIDAFLARDLDGPWTKLRDSAIWRALYEWAVASRATGRANRDASDAVAVAILARHGIEASARTLSHGLVTPHTPERN